jgi:hypothetical protein
MNNHKIALEQMLEKILSKDVRTACTTRRISTGRTTKKFCLNDTQFEALLIESMKVIRGKSSEDIWNQNLKYHYYKIF